MTAYPVPVAVAKAYIEAWANQDMTSVAGYLDADVTFEGSMARANGARAMLDVIGPFAELVTGLKILALVGDDQQAVVLYDIVTGPFGTVRAAEHLAVSAGKIQASKLVFDTYEIRKAQGTPA